MAFPPPRQKAPPPQHVLQANSGDDPADDDETINASAPDDGDGDEGSPDVPGGPMAMPSNSMPSNAPNGYSTSSLPSGQGNASIPDLMLQITTNLTPQECAELGSMLEPRAVQLLVQALPMLQPVMTAFMEVEQSQGGSGDPGAVNSLPQDADALSISGCQQQYGQGNYGAPAAPGAQGPTPSRMMMRRARGPLGMVSGA